MEKIKQLARTICLRTFSESSIRQGSSPSRSKPAWSVFPSLVAGFQTQTGRIPGYVPGKRCFVIGNGPSLIKTDVSLLRNEYTFGMNRVYLAFEEWGFQTSFLVSVNDLVIEQCWEDFQRLDLPKFFSWRSQN